MAPTERNLLHAIQNLDTYLSLQSSGTAGLRATAFVAKA